MEDYVVRDVLVPLCVVEGGRGLVPRGDGLAAADIAVEKGKVTGITAPGQARTTSGSVFPQSGRMCFPTFIDVHTHIDKSHTCARSPNPDGSLSGADISTAQDTKNWDIDDVMRRMRFSLASAYHHGTSSLRTHLISITESQRHLVWPAFASLREEWKGRIELQGVALTLLSQFQDRAWAEEVAETVRVHGGVLGAAVCCGEEGGMDSDDVTTCGPQLPLLLDRIMELASEKGLDLDFHVDENGNVEAKGLRAIGEAARRNKFKGKIVCGHCCSLASQTAVDLRCTLQLCKGANITVVTLPVVNLWLQDRDKGGRRTPRWRGTTLVKEVHDSGVSLAIASDNTRDQFYEYGDLDLLEVFRSTVSLCHLDKPTIGEWPRAITSIPAMAMGLGRHAGKLAKGGGANFILFNARNYSELLARPQADRQVVRAGEFLKTELPSYRLLDVPAPLPPPSSNGMDMHIRENGNTNGAMNGNTLLDRKEATPRIAERESTPPPHPTSSSYYATLSRLGCASVAGAIVGSVLTTIYVLRPSSSLFERRT